MNEDEAQRARDVGRKHLKNGRWDDAIRLLQKAEKLHPSLAGINDEILMAKSLKEKVKFLYNANPSLHLASPTIVNPCHSTGLFSILSVILTKFRKLKPPQPLQPHQHTLHHKGHSLLNNLSLHKRYVTIMESQEEFICLADLTF